jgi:hypothetical protein
LFGHERKVGVVVIINNMLHTYIDDMGEAGDSAVDRVKVDLATLQLLRKLSHANLIVGSVVQGKMTSLNRVRVCKTVKLNTDLFGHSGTIKKVQDDCR